MARRADRVIVCSHYMRGHVADVFGVAEARVTVIPNGIDPSDLARRRPRRAARALRRARRAARAARRPAGLREGLPARARRAARRDRAASATCASSSPARAPHEAELKRQAERLGLDGARHVPGLDRRRRPALALPDRRPLRGARRSTSRSGSSPWRRWRRLPVHRRRHRRPARGRPQREVGLRFRGARRPLARAHGRARAHRRRPARPLVTEASEHVLRFDWGDVARQTLDALPPPAAVAPRPVLPWSRRAAWPGRVERPQREGPPPGAQARGRQPVGARAGRDDLQAAHLAPDEGRRAAARCPRRARTTQVVR